MWLFALRSRAVSTTVVAAVFYIILFMVEVAVTTDCKRFFHCCRPYHVALRFTVTASPRDCHCKLLLEPSSPLVESCFFYNFVECCSRCHRSMQTCCDCYCPVLWYRCRHPGIAVHSYFSHQPPVACCFLTLAPEVNNCSLCSCRATDLPSP